MGPYVDSVEELHRGTREVMIRKLLDGADFTGHHSGYCAEGVGDAHWENRCGVE